MKSRKMLILCAVLFFSLSAGGCGAKKEEAEVLSVDVVLQQGRGFAAKSYAQTIESRTDAAFELKLQADYEITACSYSDYSVTASENGYTTLELHNVSYPTRVTVTCEVPETVLFYDPNGGFFSDTGSEALLRVVSGPSAHYRTNTLSGAAKLTRPGYVLTGWNTEADGSGTHIGLGSRITAEKNEELCLYAEWKQETTSELFTYENEAGSICLTGYSGGDTDCLVIPEEIGGTPVTAIGAGFAEKLSVETFVIPDTVLTIADGAFRNCTIENIYFSDTLEQISDASFTGSRPKYWHINAAMQPRYQAISDVTTFSDKMDLLILHADEKKLLLFSGCSMNYGVDSKLLAEACQDYTVLNLGAVGGANTQFQFEILLQYIGQGDIFLHAPEEGSPYQLMSSTECDNRMYIAVEGNFDLLSAVDMTTLGEGAFDSFRSFNEKRKTLEPCSYEDQYLQVSSLGDNDSERIAANTKQFDPDYRIHTENLTEDSLNLLCRYYDRIRAAGGTVYLSYAPINELCCSADEIAEFEETWEQGMAARGFKTISKLSDYVMEAKYFYDTDYHLTTKGAVMRTEQLIEDMAEYMQQQKP